MRQLHLHHLLSVGTILFKLYATGSKFCLYGLHQATVLQIIVLRCRLRNSHVGRKCTMLLLKVQVHLVVCYCGWNSSGTARCWIGTLMAFGTRSFAVNINNNTTTYGATELIAIAMGYRKSNELMLCSLGKRCFSSIPG